MTDRVQRRSVLSLAEAVWLIGRVPLAIAIAFSLRDAILAWLEPRFDIIFVTVAAIDILSTPFTRLIYAACFAGTLCVVHVVARFSLNRFADVAVAAAALVICTFASLATDTSLWVALLPAAVVAVNLWTVPSKADRAKNLSASERLAVLFAPVVAEMLMYPRYITALLSRVRPLFLQTDRRHTWWLYAPVFLVAGIVSSVTVNGRAIAPLEQAIRMSPEARVLLTGDFNWIDFVEERGRLYVTGHGVPRLLAYSADDFSSPVAAASVDTGGAQAFWYDAHENEVLVANYSKKAVLFLDADTLALGRVIEIPELSPGDPWIVSEHSSGAVVVASEADVAEGKPFLVLNRASGEVVDRRDLEVGNILLHPSKPLLYASFFRRENGLRVYDLERRIVALDTRSDARLDRMAYWAEANELLVASPSQARVLRYDATTLQSKGFLGGALGVRVLAIDDGRGLLLAGSLATGTIAVFDLRTNAKLRQYYVGPWLRTISLHEAAGLAYVSSNGAVYELEYARSN